MNTLLCQILTKYTDQPELTDKFSQFLDLLNKWNKTYNLTSITDHEEQIYKHIADSLAILDDIKGKNILDVGSGAGLPGTPLAIACPDKQFTLLDSNSKKTRFITQAVAELGIKNVNIAHARVESYQADRAFDCILSRAFSSIEDFLNQTRHLGSKNTRWLAMKGEYPADEITKIPQDFKVESVRELEVEGLGAKRHLIVIRKQHK